MASGKLENIRASIGKRIAATCSALATIFLAVPALSTTTGSSSPLDEIGVPVTSLPFSLEAESTADIIRSHGISTFGELKYPVDFKFFDYVNPDAPKGGSISTWGFGTFDSFNPYIVTGNAERFASLMFESLMEETADEPDSMYGLLAESIVYPRDRRWAMFILRPDARFSNGDPVEADDVVFSFETLVNDGAPWVSLNYQNIEKAEALDKNLVLFTFKEGVPTKGLPLIAAGIPIFSKEYFEGRDFAKSSLEPPIGTGPYVLDSSDPGRQAVYRRNDDYWGSSLPINAGRDNYDEIAIEYFADYTAAFEGFKAGEYNYRVEYFSKLWATAYDFPAVLDGSIVVEEIPDGEPAGTQGYFFNLRRDKFQDPRVREAIALAFNFEWSNETLFYGAYTRTDSFWENSELQASGMPSSEELELLEPQRRHLPESVFSDPAYVPPVASTERVDRKLIRKANALLDDAGWPIEGGIRTNENGETLEVRILIDSPSSERIALPFVETLKLIGIDASIDNVDYAQGQEREKTFDFDITTRRYRMTLSPGAELVSMFGSDSANAQGTYNIAGVENAGIDALIERAAEATTRAEMTVAVKALDRALRAMHIWIPQFFGSVHRVAYRNYHKRPDTIPPFDLGFQNFWWFDDGIESDDNAD
ncbi:MAG: extracellular solute-binding protein [Albidovulum sp.]|nr:extracellular solute-binding protein [Albidovulum sp.]